MGDDWKLRLEQLLRNRSQAEPLVTAKVAQYQLKIGESIRQVQRAMAEIRCRLATSTSSAL